MLCTQLSVILDFYIILFYYSFLFIYLFYLFSYNINTLTKIPVYENLVLNPGLISMPPEEFDQHVAQITQAQARAEECARSPIQVPRDLPDLEGMSVRKRVRREGRE